ncbi:MAG: hypothetical protein Q7U97_06740 [Rhodocyclaceae bacterium]|nr:hypothetical protein [Rhodocyclaceae bacterium]
MTIVYLDFPDVRPDSFEWQFSTITESFASPFTGDEQTADLPGAARWIAATVFSDLARAEATNLEAHLVECNGPAGRIRLWNMARELPLGVATGTPVVDGADNYGGLLNTRGWTPSTAGILKRGDYFSVADEIKMLLADANSDADGKAALTFGPNLRNVPADGTSIVTTKPKGIFRLLDDNQAKMKYNETLGGYAIIYVETWS